MLLPTVMTTLRAHQSAGPVTPPRPMPAIGVTTAAAQQIDLTQQLRGRVTALQLMFTGCSVTCPLQGAVFAAAQARLASAPRRAQLLSMSVDSLADDPSALAAWLARFGADPRRWTAAVPVRSQADALMRFLQATGGAKAPAPADHSTQVFFFDPDARLVLATAELPSGDEVARLLESLAAR
jgi:protein SCO1/2